jgi:hypothetical protein
MTMPLEAPTAIALLRRMAGLESAAAGRIARLLCLAPVEARAALGLAAAGTMTPAALQAELALSPGGAAALAERLEYEAVVRREPDHGRPLQPRLRLTPGAEREIDAALGPLTDVLAALAKALD